MRLRELHKQEQKLGFGTRFINALRLAVKRLETDPLVFGEALYSLPKLRVAVRQAVVDRLVIDYGVHDEKKIVFIRGFKVFS